MRFVDWSIVLAVFVGLATIAIVTKRYMRGVADFLAANRCAGRYLLTLSDGMAGLGAIGIIASFQQNYTAGLAPGWWGGIMAPLMLLLPLTGFIIYRFRETRVLTIAEFYEKRYSRRFRIFTGILAWVAGIINYGVFPQVTARFFIHFCGIPEYYMQVGPLNLNVTLGLMMAILLVTALVITFRGGQIAIMITDFFQAQFINIVFIILIVVLFLKFGYSDLVGTLQKAPEGQSMLNPFDQKDIPNFTLMFFLISAFNVIYTYMAWQGNQGYNCAARTPHDAKMARILAAWRYGATWTVILMIPIFVHVFLNSGNWIQDAASVQASIENLGNEGLQRQLTVPIALRSILPVGVFGLFVASMLAAAISTDDTYLHSWGSIFIQDVLMPFRKERLSPEQHMRWLKRSILGVAIFVWCFGMVFPLHEYIFMYWAITGAIYVGGAGSVIIGGFYWKRGTTTGAWAGMITGSSLAVAGTLINNIIWPQLLPRWKSAYPEVTWLQQLPDTFWLDGMELFFFSSLSAIAAYIIFSLLSRPDPDFEMDKLLHRGKYTIEGEHKVVDSHPNRIWKFLGVTTEYSRMDKFVVASVFAWTIAWFTVFIAGNIYCLTNGSTDSFWIKYWTINVGIYLLVGIVTTVWFLYGGFKDLGSMFKYLKEAKVDDKDDGTA
ncbi:MAG: sodium:solute symporter [Puniceicoccaceae bacterium]